MPTRSMARHGAAWRAKDHLRPGRGNMLGSRLLPPGAIRYSFDIMYRDFHARDRWTKKEVHCIYQALVVAVATRHADAVDVKFLVDGRPVWVALPLPAWVEYKRRTGTTITDGLTIEICGHYLKTALESGEGLGREMYSLTVEETLAQIARLVSEPDESGKDRKPPALSPAAAPAPAR